MGKILESIIKDFIAEHLESSGRIRQSQHRFMKGKSCLTNLLEFFEGVTSRVDKGEPVAVVYLDFQKAFDKEIRDYRARLKCMELGEVY